MISPTTPSRLSKYDTWTLCTLLERLVPRQLAFHAAQVDGTPVSTALYAHAMTRVEFGGILDLLYGAWSEDHPLPAFGAQCRVTPSWSGQAIGFESAAPKPELYPRPSDAMVEFIAQNMRGLSRVSVGVRHGRKSYSHVNAVLVGAECGELPAAQADDIAAAAMAIAQDHTEKHGAQFTFRMQLLARPSPRYLAKLSRLVNLSGPAGDPGFAAGARAAVGYVSNVNLAQTAVVS